MSTPVLFDHLPPPPAVVGQRVGTDLSFGDVLVGRIEWVGDVSPFLGAAPVRIAHPDGQSVCVLSDALRRPRPDAREGRHTTPESAALYAQHLALHG